MTQPRRRPTDAEAPTLIPHLATCHCGWTGMVGVRIANDAVGLVTLISKGCDDCGKLDRFWSFEGEPEMFEVKKTDVL